MNKERTIIIKVPNIYAQRELVAILMKLKELGGRGASRTVTFEEFGSLFWDGDGPSGISSIVYEELKKLS